MMNLLFGHWRVWVLILLIWFSLGAIASIAFGLIARVGAWRERKNDNGTV